MPYVDLQDLRLHYRRQGPRGGEKPPLLLIAGMASDSASWQPILPALAEHFDVIAPDNRCTGQTVPNPVKNSREAMLDDLSALLDALEIAQVAVVGHSMGAMLGWALAARAPERICALLAMSGLPEVTPARIDFFETLSSLRASSAPEVWYRLLFHALFSPSFFNEPDRVEAAIISALAYPHRQSTEALAAQSLALSSFIETPAIDQVSCPVLSITGEQDVLMPPSMLAKRMNSITAPGSLPGSQVQHAIVSNAAHALHWEQPEQVTRNIIDFLTQ